MIPKVIHYCWFGHSPLPKDVQDCIASWKKYCPDCEIKQWNEFNFDVHSNPYVDEAYRAKKWAFVADYARLKIIYDMGGIYLDTDVEVISPLDDVLARADCIVCEETNGRINTGVGFAATAQHPVVKAMLDQYNNAHFDLGNGLCDLTPCPIRNTRALKKMGYTGVPGLLKKADCMVLDPEIMSPINPETGDVHVTHRTVSIHHFSESWKTPEEKEAYKLKKNLQKRYGKVGTVVYYCMAMIHGIKDKGIIYTVNSMINKLRNLVSKF